MNRPFLLFLAATALACPQAAREDLEAAGQSLRKAGDEVEDAAQKTAEQLDRAASEKIDDAQTAVQEGAVTVKKIDDAFDGENIDAQAVGCAGERYVLDKALVDRVYANPMEFVGEAAVQPVQGRGYKVVQVPPNGLVSRLGLREGDIVTAVDGRSLAQPPDAEWFATLRNKTEVPVTLDRGGTRIEKTILVQPAKT